MYLTGFADEAAFDLAGQIRATQALGWKYIESRNIGGANIHDLPERDFETAAEQFAQGGRVLELAIGTGRIALPLAEKGIHVDGIDFSPSVLAELRAKLGSEKLTITLGNFADVAVLNHYNLIYGVFNT